MQSITNEAQRRMMKYWFCRSASTLRCSCDASLAPYPCGFCRRQSRSHCCMKVHYFIFVSSLDVCSHLLLGHVQSFGILPVPHPVAMCLGYTTIRNFAIRSAAPSEPPCYQACLLLRDASARLCFESICSSLSFIMSR